MMKYYNLINILKKQCQYNIVFGERSNGKTYSALKHCLEEYVNEGKEFALIRRWEEDFKGKRGRAMFDGLVNNEVIEKLTKGKFNTVYYYGGTWTLAKYDKKEETTKKDAHPFCYAFALTAMEHDKSTSYDNIKNIVFDEFLTRKTYLPDEFVTFQNVLSTIIRNKKDVKIFMLGNTVNQYCPYFVEMGLNNIKRMKQGDIDVYSYGETELKVAVEYADNQNKAKESNVYFAFDNPKLNMIKNGTWEIGIYPHLPIKYKPNEIIYIYYIQFNGETLQCNIIGKEDYSFTYIHKKTTPIKDNGYSIIYTTEYSPNNNYRRKLTTPLSQKEKKIVSYFKKDKVFYQDNEIGEIVRNYLLWCGNENITNK